MSGAVGPVWTDGDDGRYAGRFPLAVERHAMAQVGHLMPGITTVTPHARYYTLHAAVFAEAAKRSLDLAETRRLLRRVEVVVGAISIAHGSADTAAHAGMRSPHGSDYLSSRVANGVDIDGLSADGAYAKSGWGFWGPYLASEFTMGLLASEGKATVPGPNADRTALCEGFDGLFDLAARPTLSQDTLVDAHHLCMCGARASADGRMLQQLLMPRSSANMHHDDRRSQSLRMLLRLTEMAPETAARNLDQALAFGEVGKDPSLSSLEVLPAWTGVALRNFTVAGWRNLWRHLVGAIEGFMSIDALGSALADDLPVGTVREFVDSRPAGMDGSRLIGAEFSHEVQDLGPAERYLSRLVIGASRAGRLEPRTQAYFQGGRDEQYQQLTPSWLQDRLAEWADRPLRDFAVWVTQQLVARAERIALTKASFDAGTGRFRVPTRVYVRDGYVFKDSDEGGGGVALRWNSAFEVMAGIGLVSRVDERWELTESGRAA
ncbi:hypothetical protein [Mumia sp. DW29H23]|uniref:hypothetical protein n=1 Tax=Mumia sp. DW29H23 TaxID=3421241 RepID=UPI003D6832AD